MSYSNKKSVFVQQKMNEGVSNKDARRAWGKSDEKKELDRIQMFGNDDESDFDSDVNMNGTSWHTSDDL